VYYQLHLWQILDAGVHSLICPAILSNGEAFTTTNHVAMMHHLIVALYLHQTVPSMRLSALPLTFRFSGAGSNAFVRGHHSTMA